MLKFTQITSFTFFLKLKIHILAKRSILFCERVDVFHNVILQKYGTVWLQQAL